MTLRKRTARAVGWMGTTQVLAILNQLVATIILARLLGPREFGLVALATTLTGIGLHVMGLGFGHAILRLETITRAYECTAFWSQMMAGAAVTLVTLAVAPLLTRFFSEPELALLVTALAPQYLLVAAASVPLQIEQRALRTGRVVGIELGSELVGTVVAVVAAWQGLGAYSIVLRSLIVVGLQVTILWWVTGWRPSLLFSREVFTDLWRFGSGVTLTLVLSYATKRAGDIVVAKSVGTAELGFYNRAYAVTLQPMLQVTQVVGRVLIPVLAQVQQDAERLKRMFVRAQGAIGFVVFPTTLGLAACGDPLVRLLFGEPWLPMVPMLFFFCVATLANAVEMTAVQLFLLRGQSHSLFRWRLGTSAVTIVALLIGVQWGATGAAAAMAARSVLLLYFNVAVPGREIGVTAMDVARALWSVLLISVAMAVSVWGLDRAMAAAAIPLLARVFIAVAAGGGLYLGAMMLFKPPAWVDFKGVAADFIGRRKKKKQA